ncbi:MAG: ABC transporter ATP-binding protein [Actinomycetaceae bacterium]|nr:ABC transporter ATP-binding protein [Actinomycetaceae bacterium]MDY6083530.1 ABC transporter ATP-binding protein [Actinomycetaceae bacterium]
MADDAKAAAPLLDIKDLEVAFRSSTGMVPAVRKANVTIYPGQTVAIVGESGSGKSTTAAAVIGLLPGTGKVTGGQILFKGQDITQFTAKQMVDLRGSQIGMVPQDPMSNLNPVYKIGSQVAESLKANGIAKGSAAHERAVELLADAGLSEPERRAKQYPHEFSGGMRQRALIAIGLAARPDLLIADEPTSALDVTVQKQILDHLQQMTEELGTAVLFITHDLGLAAERASHLVVMHRGRVVESGPALQILQDPQHPYTKRLISAAPSLASHRLEAAIEAGEDVEHHSGLRTYSEREREQAQAQNLLVPDEVIRVENLVKEYKVRGSGHRGEVFRAVDDVSFYMRKGRTTALVGESGSGKSTVANIILNLLDPTSGKVFYYGQDLSTFSRAQLFDMRNKMQPVFQNPYGSLDPMYSIFRIVEEPMRVHHMGTKKEREDRVAELLDAVALPRSTMRRYPGELSGGQRQRVAIARALALKPEIVVLDEAVSALDVLVQAQILDLLTKIQSEMGLTYLFITHDLAVVRQTADDIVVMQNGKIVERNSADALFENPEQDYTRALIDAIPGGKIQLWQGAEA